MPLNALQRDTLFSTITMCVDTILEASIDRLTRIEWLERSISDEKPTIEEAIIVLKQYPALIKGLSEAVNVPQSARAHWRKLLICMDYDQPVPNELLKELSEFNNYNPLLMAEMRLFENKINTVTELSVIKNELLCLREAYLEMTPLVSSSYGAPYRTYFFRLGQVPFNLDKFGTVPLKTEIQDDIKRLIEDRLEQADKYQKQIDEKEKSRKEMESIVAKTRQEAESARLAASLLLDEVAEQQRRDLFKQEVFSNYRNFENSAATSQHLSISDILFSNQHFATSSKQESSIKTNRLFEMQHLFINNKITSLMRTVTMKMSQIDMELKQSKTFLDLRVAECCKVLLDVQFDIIDECVNNVDFYISKVNEGYKSKLEVTYETFLNDMVTKWMLDRKRWLSDDKGLPLNDAAFEVLSKKFKQEIENAIAPELKEFRAFQLKSSTDIEKLRGDLGKRRDKQAAKAFEYKQKWDEATMPLMELADRCNELRGLRSKIQKSECSLVTFNAIITVISKIMRGAEFTIDPAGFNLFQYACWGGNLKLVQDLLAKGAQVGVEDVQGNSVIHLAVENESMTTELLEILMKQSPFSKMSSVLELKNKRLKTPLHVAASFGNLTAVQWIMGNNTQKTFELVEGLKDNSGMTPLHYAAREGQEKVVEWFLILGIGRSITLADNNHPLVLAIMHGRLGVVHLFFKHGVWLIPSQLKYLLKIAKESKQIDHALISMMHCLAVPVIDGLNELSILNPFLKAIRARERTEVSPKTAVALLNVPSPPSTPTTPSRRSIQHLNVSGQGNNCGLFALVLGLKKNLEQKPQLRSTTKLPNFFDAINIASLRPDYETKETIELGIALRQEMKNALLKDAQYKDRRYQNFLSCCREFMEGKSSAVDMQAWLATSQEYRESLKERWQDIRDSLEQSYNATEAYYHKLLANNPLKADDIMQLQEQLSKQVLDKPEPKILTELLDAYGSNKDDVVINLIQLRRLYRSAWLSVISGTGLERNILSDCIENIFKKKILAVLQTQGVSEVYENWLLLSLLEKTNFDKNGALNLHHICPQEEVLSTAAAIFVEKDLIHHWNTVYQNYCEYIKASTSMLSADELGCLARYWNIGLKIQFARNEPYTTYQNLDVSQLHVTLCNPSRVHWNVVCDGEQFDMKWDSSKIIALISSIENFAYKTYIIDAINNEMAYARRLEDCSYVVGLSSAIQEMPNVLLRQGITLNAADIGTSKVLSHYFEHGLLRINAEQIYSLKDLVSSIKHCTESTGTENTLLLDFNSTRERAVARLLPTSGGSRTPSIGSLSNGS